METHMLRWCLDTEYLDWIANKKIRLVMRVAAMKEKLFKKRLGWFEHVYEKGQKSYNELKAGHKEGQRKADSKEVYAQVTEA